MINMTFVERVKSYFGYLSEYGFKVDSEVSSDVRPGTDGAVVYVSSFIGIVIDSEMGNAAVWFYRIEDGRKYDLDPVLIHEYLTTSDREKKFLLSTNPADNSAVTALFNQKFLLNQPSWNSQGTTEEKLEARLLNYANWLKQHADVCLKGEISGWLRFYEYKIHRSRADYLRLGKEEIGPAAIRDSDGKWKTVKQSRFKDKLDYIEKLKREASK